MLHDDLLRHKGRGHVDSLIDELVEIRSQQTWDSETVLQAIKVTGALKSVLAASGIGECRRSTPFSEMQPIFEADGTFHWCCAHTPPHCHP